MLITLPSYRSAIIGGQDAAAMLIGGRNVWGKPGFDPIDLFAGGYTGRLYDLKPGKSVCYTDAGITPATVGQSVYQIQDRTGGGDAVQTNSSFRGVLQGNGSVLVDGVDDFYNTGQNPFTHMTVFVVVDVDAESYGTIIGTRAANPAAYTIYVLSSGRLAVSLGGTQLHTVTESDIRGSRVFVAYEIDPAMNSKVWIGDALVGDYVPQGRNPGNIPSYLGALNYSGVAMNYTKMSIYAAGIINRHLTESEIALANSYWTEA